MKKISKEEKEDAAINLCHGLDNVYHALRDIPNPDLHGLRILALCYEESRMPRRAEEIRREVNRLTEGVKCVPSDVIIDPSLANGGTHENPIPVRIVRRIRADCLHPCP